MTGRSGIGVLVAGFSRVGALKKHAPLVFNLYYMILNTALFDQYTSHGVGYFGNLCPFDDAMGGGRGPHDDAMINGAP